MASRLLAAFLTSLVAQTSLQPVNSAPSVTVRNGTYTGLFQPNYGQDFFLGIPYAQPPLKELRLAVPQHLNTSWRGTRNATAYYPECVGYGGDDIGYETNEDCLALNVVRPAGMDGKSLPVAVWIHGGGYFSGGTPDRRYNLSFIVENSVTIGKPIIGVSIAYRLSGFGFLYSEEIQAAGATNLGIRDQHLALQWIQENIASFGGDPTKVTIWGESAGAGSVGIHLTLHGEETIISFVLPLANPARHCYLDLVTRNSLARRSIMRQAPFEKLNQALNATPPFSFFPYVDGDLIRGSIYKQLQTGAFIKVPYLIGANTDEGSFIGPHGINTDTAFEAYLNATGADYETVKILEIVYPNIPALGVLETITYTPNPPYGSQFKRVASFAGDYSFIAARRLVCEQWAKYDASAYSYRFNNIVTGIPAIYGSAHFQEVAFVFDNTQGLGYAINPFEGKPPRFYELAKLMSTMWVAFVHDGDPNGHGQYGVPEWPRYDNGAGGYGQNFVFDANVSSHAEPDTFRGVAIAYINSIWESQFGK